MFEATNVRRAVTGLLPAFALMATACAPAKNAAVSAASNNAIVNGTDTTTQDVGPNGVGESVVLIIGTIPAAPGKPGMSAICTGTLIDPQVVLTAAHCVSGGMKPEGIRVGLHYTRALQPGQDMKKDNPLASGYDVKSFQVNAGYSDAGLGQQQNDIALILLAKPVPAGTRIATLPEASVNVENLEAVMPMGYGMSDEKHSTDEDHQGVGVLRYTTFAQGTFGYLPTDSAKKTPFDGMIASIAKTTSVCHGDSGGPLMAVANGKSTNTVVGVNDAVLPQFADAQEEQDWEAAEQTGDSEGFYKKYPDAAVCSGGLNVFVNVAGQLDWINSTKKSILAQAGGTPAPAPAPAATPAPSATPAPVAPANGEATPKRHRR